MLNTGGLGALSRDEAVRVPVMLLSLRWLRRALMLSLVKCLVGSVLLSPSVRSFSCSIGSAGRL